MGLVKNGRFKTSLLLIIGCVLFYTGSIYAQGDYLELGQDGGQVGFYFVGSKYISNENMFGGGFIGGLSHYGIIEGQISVGINHLTKYSGIAYVFSPSFVIYPIKQGMASIPFSVALGASYQFANHTGKDVSIYESSSAFGAWLLSNISINESFIFLN